jgi:hypothetical protein
MSDYLFIQHQLPMSAEKLAAVLDDIVRRLTELEARSYFSPNAIMHSPIAAAQWTHTQHLVSQWRPISEAPKDGTWILGTNADKIPCVVGWDEIYGCWGTHYPGYERKMKSFVPTHWMPLPAPPGKEAP